jgi:gamma-glutamyltranspeptidase/glutathione hydrolase
MNRDAPSSLIADPFSSSIRPALTGVRAAISAAHPLGAAAGQHIVELGGNAVDAAIAAQAVVGVVAPEAGGVGGDGFFIVREPGGAVTAVNAAGAAPLAGRPERIGDDGTSVNVPGLVAGWADLSSRFGRLKLAQVLAPAIQLAAGGVIARPNMAASAERQRERLLHGGAEGSAFLSARAGEKMRQPALASTLSGIAEGGAAWFYGEGMGAAVARAVSARGGLMTADDLAAHRSVVCPPLSVTFRGRTVHVQPPMSQGVLLAMALQGFERLGAVPADRLDHAAAELTESVFAYRDRCGEGAALLGVDLPVDLDRAGRRGGPRSYLHTAGVAVADAEGWVVSSLFSVFDSFGSAIYVPEGGFVLNNRAASFTRAPNDVAPGKLPVHTLAPMLMEGPEGVIAMATPGADGQVQTLLQIVLAIAVEGVDIATAIHRPRWRSEDNRLLVESGHPATATLAALGHDVAPMPFGDLKAGGVVCAGLAGATPFAASDFRRENWSGVV